MSKRTAQDAGFGLGGGSSSSFSKRARAETSVVHVFLCLDRSFSMSATDVKSQSGTKISRYDAVMDSALAYVRDQMDELAREGW